METLSQVLFIFSVVFWFVFAFQEGNAKLFFILLALLAGSVGTVANFFFGTVGAAGGHLIFMGLMAIGFSVLHFKKQASK